MKTKEELISDMCLTYRHDFYLDGAISQNEKDYILSLMTQLYIHCFEPQFQELQKKNKKCQK